MRISDWSSDVCSSDLTTAWWRSCARRATRWSGSARPVRTGKRPGDCDAVPGSVYSVRASARRRRIARPVPHARAMTTRSEEHTSELQSLMRISYAVFCLKKKKTTHTKDSHHVFDKKKERLHTQ